MASQDIPKVLLLDLVQTVQDYSQNDNEIVATIVYLINSGRVQLCGTFAGAKITLTRQGSPSTAKPATPCQV